MDQETDYRLVAASEETEPQKLKRRKTILSLLIKLEKESAKKAQYNLVDEGLFKITLRASFAKAFEYARNCYRIKPNKTDEGCYFLASALRSTSEELIALLFIRQLSAGDRDEVIKIEMFRSLNSG